MTGLATTRAINRTTGHLYTLVEKGREYGPYPGATALTALQDSLGGMDGLIRWSVNLAVDAAEANTDKDWNEVRGLAHAATKQQRDLGIAVHSIADQINRGHPPTMFTEGVAPYVAQYGAALYQKGIRILGSERYTINTTIGVGGTYDSLVEIDGEVGPLDVKTGKEKPSQRLQLAVLSMGEWHGEQGCEAEPMPELSGVGFILLLRPDGYELIRHEISNEDREHVARLADTYHHIRAWAAAYAPTAIREEIAA
jgi:hypothetical protein